MKINFLIFFALLMLTALWTFLANRTVAPSNIVTAEKIANFDYLTLNEEKGNLHQHEGQVILLHFWATWCAPCLVELPALIDLAASQKNLIVLAVAVQDDLENIQRFINKTGRKIPNNFIIAFDEDKHISAQMFNTVKLPESFLIRPNLTLERRIIGAQDDWNSDFWREQINRLSTRT
jgi:thiol-disulfide isomerase/thioredoxin